MGAEFEEGTTEVIEQAARQLDEYFSEIGRASCRERV